MDVFYYLLSAMISCFIP